MTTDALFIGWDVGAWHCDSSRSQDALVVLSQNGVIGRPWWGNLKHEIHKKDHPTFRSLIASLCGSSRIEKVEFEVVLAIDATLGFPTDFIELSSLDSYGRKGEAREVGEDFQQNPYLFRYTERRLAEMGFTPLSAVNHQIGSQATKALHLLRYYGFKIKELGVWSQTQEKVTAIETYPVVCKTSKKAIELKERFDKTLISDGNISKPLHQKKDEDDALWCAIIAKLFHENQLEKPNKAREVSRQEGWIWVPEDCKANENGGDANAR
jgi:hypothetical protein